MRVLPSGGHLRAFSFGVSTLDTSPAAARRVVGGGDCSEVLGWFPPSLAWTWEFLVGSTEGRLWLGRFLVAVRPRWSMRDQFRAGTDVGTSDQE